MVKDSQIKPFSIYFEKELRYFLFAIALLGFVGNVLDLFTYYSKESIFIYNIFTIFVISAVVLLYIIKKHSIKLSFIIIIYTLLSNIIFSFLFANPSESKVFFFFRESIFIILLLTISTLFVNVLNGIIVLIIYLGFYVAVIKVYNLDFLISNIYIIFLMLVSYTVVLIFFSRKFNNAIIEIQKDTALINEQNEELRTINNELSETQKLISTQNEELLSLTDDLHKKNDLILAKNEELTEAIKSKNLFFSIIAHDLKSPIGSMTELTELMLARYSSLNDEKKQNWIKNIYKSSKSLYELLENLLLWSRTNLGIIKPKLEEITIFDTIEKLRKIFNQSLTQKKINFYTQFEKDLIVVSDKMMIETILRNLISNAIKFSKENGNVEININSENPAQIVICVKDSGVGISEEYLKKLDNIENKFSTPGTSGEKGTGLGLHLCKLFSSKLNGHITITSVVNEGTTICTVLPTNKR